MRKVFVLFIVFWQILWSLAPHIPRDIRPTIDVRSLSAWDRGMFIVLPHQVLSHIQSPALDIFTAIPYTIHIVWPFVFVIWCFFKRRELTLPYMNCFGLLSLLAVCVELVFPTAPPWYYEKYGYEPASYDLQGDPAGLARVDTMFNTTFYLDTFVKSPVVFGAFPSLHVAWPTLICLFLCMNVLFSWKTRWIPIFYVAWVSFAVVYLQHHYVADVLGGMLLAWSVYEVLGPHRRLFQKSFLSKW